MIFQEVFSADLQMVKKSWKRLWTTGQPGVIVWRRRGGGKHMAAWEDMQEEVS